MEAAARKSDEAGPLARARVLCYTGSVANLTVTIDDEVLKKARIRALEQGTSVNAIVAEHLRAFAGKGESQARAVNALVELASENTRGGKRRAKQRGRRRWTRDEIHERR
jgi:hypothetical protein